MDGRAKLWTVAPACSDWLRIIVIERITYVWTDWRDADARHHFMALQQSRERTEG